ncbi:MAG: ABC transporter permease subunit [Polyangiaceae bacterium]|nr:ABC transporter permease subunit [Polyangiaceae bacterium]MCW5790778.1 ABC transporter permease subunit [Polyangiaceae bacterium]
MSLRAAALCLGLGLIVSLGSLAGGGSHQPSAGPLMVTAAGAGASLMSVGLGFGLALLGAIGPPPGARLLRRLVELFGVLPTLVSALLVLMWSPHFLTLLGLVGLFRSVRIARSLAGELRRLSRQPFAEASRALGAPLGRRVRRDLLPGVLPLLAAEAASGILWTLALVVSLDLAGASLPGLDLTLGTSGTSGGARIAWLGGAALLSLGLLGVLLRVRRPEQG